jgi:hypothetical protein
MVRTYLRTIICAGLIAGLWGCGESGSTGSPTQVTLTLKASSSAQADRSPSAPAPSSVESVRLVMMGDGLDPITEIIAVNGGTVSVTLSVPSVNNAVFEATAYDSPNGAGQALYQGRSSPVDLEPGEDAAVEIQLQVLLVSITVTPSNATIVVGAVQQFTATGGYGDGTTQDLTTQVAWSSSSTGIAAIGSTGLAVGIGVGGTTITARLGSASDTAALTVNVVPLGPPIPQIARLSLASGIIGDTLKISGINFGSTQGSSTVTIGGVIATTILRWTDVAIAAIIPAGVTVSSTGATANVIVAVGGRPSNPAPVNLFDHTHGIGENESSNLDKFVLDVATTSVTVSDLTGTDFGQTNSIVLSSDGNTVAEADILNYTERVLGFDTTTPAVDFTYVAPSQDVSISRSGTTVLQVDGTNTLVLFPNNFTTASPVDTPITGPAGVCFYEVALTSDGNTAAAIGQDTAFSPCDGAHHVYRIDSVLGTPTFTPVATAGSGDVYTDVAISEDGKTVIIGKINSAVSAGIERVTNFNTLSPVVLSDQIALVTGCTFGVNAVDVDLSADGVTGVAGIAGCSFLAGVSHEVFQILDADLSSSVSASVATPSNLEGVAVNSGGSVALVRVNEPATPFTSVTWIDGFNQPSPTATDINSLVNFNTTTPARNQDQIDLQ